MKCYIAYSIRYTQQTQRLDLSQENKPLKTEHAKQQNV